MSRSSQLWVCLIVLVTAQSAMSADWPMWRHDSNRSGSANRVFDVAIGDAQVLADFDVAKKAGGRNRIVVREFTGIPATGELELSFTAKAGEPVVSGVEVVAEAPLESIAVGGE